MKDILIDNNVAKNFCNPLDDHYKALVEWLFNKGFLVVTQRLLIEYSATSALSRSCTSMPALVDHLLRSGRLRKFGKVTLSDFRFGARVQRSLRSNKEDHDSIKAVMLSERKFALSHDNNLRHDINTFPGYHARAEQQPQDLPYE
jgi:hypothetical protein